MPETPYDTGQAAGLEALETLRLMIADEDVTAAARVSAAKALLDRFSPKEDAELKRREAEERENAIADARHLLAALAAAEPARADEPDAVAANSEAGTDNASL
jgi:hypothetical protein